MCILLIMFGIIIGIVLVVLIVVVGDVVKQMVLVDICVIGINIIDVYSGKDFGDDDLCYQQVLKYDDLLVIQKQLWVCFVMLVVLKSLCLCVNNIDVVVSVEGVGLQYFNVYGMIFSEGNIFNELQFNSWVQVVVFDSNICWQLFFNKVKVVGEVILVGNMLVMVIGVVDEKQLMFGSSKIFCVWLFYIIMVGRVMGQLWLNFIIVCVYEGYDSEIVEKQLLCLLELWYGKKDVFIWNMDSVLKIVERIIYILQLFLILVVVIVLVVGGIGVMNIMLVLVIE